MSQLPLWRDLIAAESPAQLQEAYPPSLDKDTPVPVSEREMTDAEMKKREEIVKSMKDRESEFKDRYGDRWKEVMYATATKMAMSEDKKPYAWKCMECNHTWRSNQSGQTSPVRCPKCGASGEDDILPGRISEEAEPCDCGNDPCTCDHAAMLGEAEYLDQMKQRHQRERAALRASLKPPAEGADAAARAAYDERRALAMRSLQAKQKRELENRVSEAMQRPVRVDDHAAMLGEAPETFVVMAIADTNPAWKQGGSNYKPNAKVIDQMHSLEQKEVGVAAKMLRKKHPKATISVENKGGRIVKVFKPGQPIQEAEEQPSMFDKHGAGKADTSPEGSWFPGMKAWLMKAYRQNERNNNHTGNALLMVRLFGTPQEVLLVQKLADIREKEGFIDATKYKNILNRVDALHSKYYRQLQSMKEEVEAGSDYETYFRDMLKKHGYDSPADIPDDKKDDFFNAVDVGYSAKNEGRKLWEGSDDQEMLSSQLHSIATKAATLHEALKTMNIADVPAWIQDKVSVSDHSISAIVEYFMHEQVTPDAGALAEAPADAMVPLRLQAAMVIAKSLGGVKGSGAAADFRAAGSSPEALVNQALRVWLQGSHTNEGWALGAKMLKLAKQMGIEWDEKLLKGKMAPLTMKKLGLTEFVGGYDAGTVSSAREGQKKNQLSLQQTGERSALKQRHEKEREQAKTGLDRDRLVSKHEREREQLKQKHDKERAQLTEQDTEMQRLRQKHAQQKAALQQQQTREKVSAQERKMQDKLQQMQAKAK